MIREWCCNTPIAEPHTPGCPFDPTGPIDYLGPCEIKTGDTGLLSACDDCYEVVMRKARAMGLLE